MESIIRSKFNMYKCLNNVITYVIAIIMIINCNSIYTVSVDPTLLNRFNLFTLIISVALLVWLHGFNNVELNKYIVTGGILSVYIMLYILIQRNHAVIQGGILELLKFLLIFSLVYLVYRTVAVPRIFQAYCNVVSLIALVSLFFWFFGSILHFLSPTGVFVSNWNQFSVYQAVPSYYNLYFETQVLGGLTRNSAIFAEAPMASLSFSIALSLEILYLKNKKLHVLKIAILSLAIITTMSSTGYICLTMILIYQLLFTQSKNSHIATLKLFLIPIVLLGGLISIRYFLSQKLSTSSGSSRSQDYINSFKTWLKYPFFGAGINMGSNLLPEDRWMIGKFGYSNSFGKILGENGIYILALYVISIGRSIYIGIKNMKKERLFFTLIILYLFITTIFINTYVCYFFFSLLAIWNPEEPKNLNDKR